MTADSGGEMVLGEGEPAAGPWRVVPTTHLAGLLRGCAGASAGRPRVVAVDGRSGSGKTTVARRIRAAVPASAVVHTDDIAWRHSILGWADLLADGVLHPVRLRQPVSFRPPAWQEHAREGAIEVPAGCELVIVEGVGSARRELMHLVDTVLWVQSDMAEAERRGIARDGGDEAAVSFWHLWMAEELPFMAQQRPWERAAVVVAGTPQLAHDPRRQAVIAPPVTFPPPATGA